MTYSQGLNSQEILKKSMVDAFLVLKKDSVFSELRQVSKILVKLAEFHYVSPNIETVCGSQLLFVCLCISFSKFESGKKIKK